MERVFCRFTRPTPSQVLHGSEMVFPVPWHFWQVCCIEKNPCWMRTCPLPPQVAQVFGEVPALAPLPWQVSQVSMAGMRILVS